MLRQVQLELRVDADPVEVQGDPVELQQLILTLLIHGAEAMGAQNHLGGGLAVRCLLPAFRDVSDQSRLRALGVHLP